MDWSDYQLILAVVRERTVRGGARVLGVSHATVSRRLAYLNGLAGGPFVQKSPAGLWPTKSGQAILEAAEKMEVLTAEAARRQRASEQNLSGSLTISMGGLVLKHLLFESVTRFADLYPDIELTIDGSDGFVDLDRAEADIVIRTSHNPPAHWVGRRLFSWGASLYAHKDYLASTPAEERQWIAPPEDEPRWREWRAQSVYPDASVALTITDIPGRFEAIKRGLGMGRAACFMADPDPDLVRLEHAPIAQQDPFWLLVHPDFAQTARAKAGLRFFADELTALRGLIEGRP
ncbi:MAG: LysR family transcriptional regulator [Alphaproteobacteria bacterium]|nr:LysR family transcriptional regulator [Alphaproteobacteria bacterium]